MKRRVLVSMMAVLSVSGLAFAQSGGDKPKDPPKDAPKTTPAKVTPPAKDTGKDGAKDNGDNKDKVAEPTLKAGMAAPKLTINDWVKGSAVNGFDKGKVYVIEFWATWCPPCIKSIPHLTEVQKKHKDKVTIIGVASSERDKESAKRLDKVKTFVNEQGDKMNYTVGYDADRKMITDWMKPAGQGGIPCAFIVGGDGKIAWIGNPLSDKFDGEIEKAITAANQTASAAPTAKH